MRSTPSYGTGQESSPTAEESQSNPFYTSHTGQVQVSQYSTIPRDDDENEVQKGDEGENIEKQTNDEENNDEESDDEDSDEEESYEEESFEEERDEIARAARPSTTDTHTRVLHWLVFEQVGYSLILFPSTTCMLQALLNALNGAASLINLFLFFAYFPFST